jgi:dCTP deaminase
MNNITIDSAFDLALFKTIDRISRFYRHIHDVKYENMDYYIDIISEIDDCLQLILGKAVVVVQEYDSKDARSGIESLLNLIGDLRNLHKIIGCLPIIDKQVELLRFKRVLKEGLKGKIDKKYNFSIGLGEIVDQEVYLKTPVSKFKDDLLKKIQKEDNENVNTDDPQSHITIPRIEIKNPIAWPTVAHEISHRLIDFCFPQRDYFDKFKKFIMDEGTVLPKAFSEDKTKHHILEYWCDFLGLLIMGRSFWFSQCDAMFFAGINNLNLENHPPNQLRLWVIREILKHRFGEKNSHVEKWTSESYYDVFRLFRIVDDKINSDDIHLSMQFFRYITKEFIFRNDNIDLKFAPALKNLLENFFDNTGKDDNIVIVSELIKSLEQGFPIPSVRIKSSKLKETPTSIQDILFAGALYKVTMLKNKVVHIFKDIANGGGDIGKTKQRFQSEISTVLGGLDYCLLRSIQVSEYVNLLKKDEEFEHSNRPLKRSLRKRSQGKLRYDYAIYNVGKILNDIEIKSKILMREISVIPLIDEGQIGSTSLDVRLGTSFQIYQSNHSGIIDLICTKSLEEAERNSFMIDLDFLEGLVLAPGQFVLGHTLEYLLLPANIAAELEGRSTYARLGLEIHMTAGFVDPGFNGVLTLELFNAGPNPVKIYPGLRIGQLRFFECNVSSKPYNRNIYAKYKGLLSHSGSLFVKDYEIKCYENAINKDNLQNNEENKDAKQL